jgi:ABC-2 type transport system ATP-binding protein
MEILLTGPAWIPRVEEIVRRHIERDGKITSSTTEAVVRFHTALREDDLASLLRALACDPDLGVTQFREVQTDLEEAFMTVARSTAEEGDREESESRPSRSAPKTPRRG